MGKRASRSASAFAQEPLVGLVHLAAEGLHQADPGQHHQLRHGHHPQGRRTRMRTRTTTQFDYTKSFATDPATGEHVQPDGRRSEQDVRQRAHRQRLHRQRGRPPQVGTSRAWTAPPALRTSTSDHRPRHQEGHVRHRQRADILDCTYTNRARGTIIVEKITDDGDGAFDFTSTTLTGAVHSHDDRPRRGWQGLRYLRRPRSWHVRRGRDGARRAGIWSSSDLLTTAAPAIHRPSRSRVARR